MRAANPDTFLPRCSCFLPLPRSRGTQADYSRWGRCALNSGRAGWGCTTGFRPSHVPQGSPLRWGIDQIQRIRIAEPCSRRPEAAMVDREAAAQPFHRPREHFPGRGRFTRLQSPDRRSPAQTTARFQPCSAFRIHLSIEPDCMNSFFHPHDAASTCPGCGTVVHTPQWLALDVEADAKQLAKTIAGTLHEVRCTACGTTYDADLPLILVNLRAPAHPFLFSPARAASDAETRAAAAALLTHAREVTGASTLPGGTTRLPVAPHHLLPMVLDGGWDTVVLLSGVRLPSAPLAARLAHLTVTAEWRTLLGAVRGDAELISPAAEAVLARWAGEASARKDLAGAAGVQAVRTLLRRRGEIDEKTVQWEQELLDKERQHLPDPQGTPAADGGVTPELARLRFLVPDTWRESIAVLRAHPQAVPGGEAALRAMAAAADGPIRAVLEEHADFLRRVADGGPAGLDEHKRHLASRVDASRLGTLLHRALDADDAAAAAHDLAALNASVSAWDALHRESAILFHPWVHASALQSAAASRRRRYALNGDPANLSEALPLIDAALARFATGSYAWSGARLERGLLFRVRFDAGAALADLDAAVAEYRGALEAEPGPQTALVYAALGGALRLRYEMGGDVCVLDEAIAALQRAIAQIPAGGADWAACQNNLGGALATRVSVLGTVSDLDAAIEAYQAALSGKPDVSFARANTLANMAETLRIRYLMLGRTADLDASVRTLRTLLDDFPPGGPAWGRWHDMLGLSLLHRYSARGRPADLRDARAAFEVALAHVPPGAGDRLRIVANVADALRDVHRATGDPALLDEALGLLRQAAQDAGPGDRAEHLSDLGLVLTDRFFAMLDEADRVEALDAYARAEPELDPDIRPRAALGAVRWAALLHAARDDWPRAVPVLERGLRAVEALYQGQLLEAGHEATLAMAGDVYRDAAYALARAGRVEEAAVTMEHGRARISGEGAARDHAELGGVRTRSPELYDAYRGAVAQLHRLEHETRGAALPDRAAGTTSPETRWRAAEARRVLGEAVDAIRLIPNYEGFLAPPDLESLRAAARPGEPLVYLLAASAGGVALVVHALTTKGAPVEAVWSNEFAAATLNDVLFGRDGALGYLAGLGEDDLLPELLPSVLAQIGEQLIEPLAATLRARGARGVTLVPAGRLSLLPLHAAEYRVHGRLVRLLDEFTVRTAPSARLLSLGRKAAERAYPVPTPLVVVGNPLPHPWPLKFARPEAESVAALSGGARPLMEFEATRRALLDVLPGAACVHLACHGRFDPGDPLHSGLELADGVLSLRELLDERALEGVRLVALSACQTAVTEFRRVPDEAVGLPAACLRSGAAGVVSTLWSVADASTALLMVRFWEGCLMRAGAGAADPVAALRDAQRWLRDTTTGELRAWVRGRPLLAPVIAELEAVPGNARPYADPFYWAPFTFVGA